MIDRRKGRRERCKLMVQLQRAGRPEEDLIKNSFTFNVSKTGAGIVSFDFYPVNEKIDLKLFSGSMVEIVNVIGKVVWVEEVPYQHKYKIGLEFADAAERMDNVMRNIMDEGKVL